MQKKNKLHIDEITYKNILKWLRIQTIFILVSSMLSFCIVEWGMNDYKLSWEPLLRSLGLIIPMALFITIINMINAKSMAKQANDLADGLAKAASGDYHAKLDPKKSAIFAVAYDNFNKLEEELKKANTLQDEFVNNYSHEFKTPITSIKGFAELLLEEKIDEKLEKKYLKIIVEESAKLTHLANSSILLTKLNSQGIIPNKKYFSLDEQIRRCIIVLEPEYSKKKINVTCNLEEVKYFGSEEIMEHLWMNLINNAIKYTPDGGNIIINLRVYSQTIIFSVIDSGIGMTKEEIKQIFNKFYQVDKSKTTKGLGLGLTIVSRIVELVKGKIKVESEPNKGSIFTVTLYKN
ncbi:MAG: HAMP domain-containing histidine kinase [Bacilli bacterium]|nr:HAMP domain-containing histidine kinase [Bacilli bacterium]